ncbi:Hydrogenase-4 component B [Achromobacter xylosoxidans]|nr:Hydrogenase-4 component B [Achromobacter xylosoxidans]CUJ20001.1 Hydrogenase-4 component B [Achromobacter xylosoxidans]
MRCGWLMGAALSLAGACGIFGSQDGYVLLISWELMSLGAGAMLLSEGLGREAGMNVLFMLALLEVGAVALLIAILLLSRAGGGSMGVAALRAGGITLSDGMNGLVGALVVVGFGAKLGLLPFYEWLPRAYGGGSGASGALMSGIVLNAAFFALSRALVQWQPEGTSGSFWLGAGIVIVGVLSAILAALYAFQQDDWRRLLAYSSAENASIAVTVLGACLLFRGDGHADLAALAWTVSLLHMAGHALAKGGLFLCADAVAWRNGRYAIEQNAWLRRSGIVFGAGALLCTMSLAAIPPQMGFVSEWFVFQTLFQGFHMDALGGRLILALAGAGMALTAAVSLATFVKLFGLGLLGAPAAEAAKRGAPVRHGIAIVLLGITISACAVGLPIWLPVLDGAGYLHFGAHAAQSMVSGWLLVPLTNTFAFISPSKLIVAMPLLGLCPLLLMLNARRHNVRRSRVWYGGMREDQTLAGTTALSFSNAMRTFYRFIYHPVQDTAREHQDSPYFLRRLDFRHGVAGSFDPLIFQPIRKAIWAAAGYLRALQSGDLNFYLALIGMLLFVILSLTLL